MKNRLVIIITGPTAVGKTDLTVQLAKQLNSEIISADSMQIYRDMQIGTAAPSVADMQGIPHHLISFVDPSDNYSVAQYAKEARSVIEQLFESAKIPIITGGTGLYINSLLYKMDFSDVKSNELLRTEITRFYNEQGTVALYERLKRCNPQVASTIHPNNIKRIIRAIEIAEMGREQGTFKTDLKLESSYQALLFVLSRDRQELYMRINQRVDMMLKNGLLPEVSRLRHCGLNQSHQSMQGIGYKEILAHLAGEYNLDQAIDLIKRNSRRYAKRQLTWFRRYDFAKWYNINSDTTSQNVVEYILSVLSAGN